MAVLAGLLDEVAVGHLPGHGRRRRGRARQVRPGRLGDPRGPRPRLHRPAGHRHRVRAGPGVQRPVCGRPPAARPARRPRPQPGSRPAGRARPRRRRGPAAHRPRGDCWHWSRRPPRTPPCWWRSTTPSGSTSPASSRSCSPPTAATPTGSGSCSPSAAGCRACSTAPTSTGWRSSGLPREAAVELLAADGVEEAVATRCWKLHPGKSPGPHRGGPQPDPRTAHRPHRIARRAPHR